MVGNPDPERQGGGGGGWDFCSDIDQILSDDIEVEIYSSWSLDHFPIIFIFLTCLIKFQHKHIHATKSGAYLGGCSGCLSTHLEFQLLLMLQLIN